MNDTTTASSSKERAAASALQTAPLGSFDLEVALVKTGIEVRADHRYCVACEVELTLESAEEHMRDPSHLHNVQQMEDDLEVVRVGKGLAGVRTVDIPVLLPGGRVIGTIVIQETANWEETVAHWSQRSACTHLMPPAGFTTGKAWQWTSLTAVLARTS